MYPDALTSSNFRTVVEYPLGIRASRLPLCIHPDTQREVPACKYLMRQFSWATLCFMIVSECQISTRPKHSTLSHSTRLVAAWLIASNLHSRLFRLHLRQALRY